MTIKSDNIQREKMFKMSLTRQELLNTLDPFSLRANILRNKTTKELEEYLNKSLTSVYEYQISDYDENMIFKQMKVTVFQQMLKDSELRKREAIIRQRENDVGIQRNSSSKRISSRNNDITIHNSPAVIRREPDQPKVDRLIDNDSEDADILSAIENSRKTFDIEESLRYASDQSLQHEESVLLESHKRLLEKQVEREKIQGEIRKKYENDQDDFENSLGDNAESSSELISSGEDECIEIDENLFKDRPADVTMDFLKEMCILLKQKKFSEANRKMSEISPASSRWLVRIKCKNGTMRGKITSSDPEAYKCILCRDVK